MINFYEFQKILENASVDPNSPEERAKAQGKKFSFNKYLMVSGNSSKISNPKNPTWIKCDDGFIFNVKAGELFYSEPRENKGPWSSFEINSINKPEPLLNPYMDSAVDQPDPDDPHSKPSPPNPMGGTVTYGYVPVEVVEQIINKHRGIMWPLNAQTWQVDMCFE